MTEGYVLHCYGDDKFVRHAVACLASIRRYDRTRPVALYAAEGQIETLRQTGLDRLFHTLEILPSKHRSIVGFKHHLDRFHPFEACLYLDSDMIWCRDPDPLWRQLSAFEFTATGIEKADFFFGAPKGPGVLVHYFLNHRRRTMRRFGATYLPRVQAGMIYSSRLERTASVCREAASLLSRRSETHFSSRLQEGRSEESCEWSLALAMSRLGLPIFPWFQGQNTPQIDYIDGFVKADAEFRNVSCLYYNDRVVHNLRGISNGFLRNSAIRLLTLLPGKGDYMWITPFVLHFGWLRYKNRYDAFANRVWKEETGVAPGIDQSGTAVSRSATDDASSLPESQMQ